MSSNTSLHCLQCLPTLCLHHFESYLFLYTDSRHVFLHSIFYINMTSCLSCILLWEVIISTLYAYLLREKSPHSSGKPFWGMSSHSIYTVSVNAPWHSSSIPFLEMFSILHVLISVMPSHSSCRQFWKMSSNSLCKTLWDLKNRNRWVVSGTVRWQEAFLTKDRILLVCLHPEIGTSSIDWAQLSRFLPEDGDRIQSPKRLVLKNKQGGF
jgi:hypothetical protein